MYSYDGIGDSGGRRGDEPLSFWNSWVLRKELLEDELMN